VAGGQIEYAPASEVAATCSSGMRKRCGRLLLTWRSNRADSPSPGSDEFQGVNQNRGNLILVNSVPARAPSLSAAPAIAQARFQEAVKMPTRRQFVIQSTALIAGASPMLARAVAKQSYEETVRSMWRHSDMPITDAKSIQRELVRYATLAASSHNTQCWKFRIEDRRISILPDFSRRCPVVDPDDHHLYASLGCAAENLIQAAAAFGFSARAIFDASGEGAMHVDLDSASAIRSPLFDAIPQRQCTRGMYDGQPVSADDMSLLERAG
jgi:hypothetical protein